MKKIKIEYIWKDRKRFLGMPLSFTKYTLSEDRIFFEKGFLNQVQEETLLYRVRDISLKRSFGQRLCGVGSILVHSSDKTNPIMELKNIKHPKQVKEMLHQQVEKVKIDRNVRLGEMIDDGDGDMMPPPHDPSCDCKCHDQDNPRPPMR